MMLTEFEKKKDGQRSGEILKGKDTPVSYGYRQDHVLHNRGDLNNINCVGFIFSHKRDDFPIVLSRMQSGLRSRYNRWSAALSESRLRGIIDRKFIIAKYIHRSS
jgi:hypothetical protein